MYLLCKKGHYFLDTYHNGQECLNIPGPCDAAFVAALAAVSAGRSPSISVSGRKQATI